MIGRLTPLLLLMSLLAPATHASGAVASCTGRDATLEGTEGPDVLTGTDGDDVIAGLGGNDVIRGRAGHDRICGGPGHDSLFGGDGDDRIEGGPGPDFLIGNRGADRLGGGPDVDDCYLADAGQVTSCAPVVAAAGDIACDPGDANFNDGEGTEGACRQGATSDLLAGENVRGVLALGDLQYEDGRLRKFEDSYDPSWGRFLEKTYPSPGNHEYVSGAEGYFDYFGRRAGPAGRGYHGAALAGWELMALNSNCGAVGGCEKGSAQQRWLRGRLEHRPARCVIAFWHHPRFSSGYYGDDATTDGLWRTLHAAHADLVLAGHSHSYERMAPLRPAGRPGPGMRSFVVGTGGRSLYAMGERRAGSVVRIDDTFGVLLLSLHRGEYGWAFVAEDGNVLDRGHAGCRR